MAKGQAFTTILGNVGQDPEFHPGQNGGNDRANLSVAVSETWKDPDGAKRERTDWYRVVVWGGLAKVVRDYVRAGDPIALYGRMVSSKYTKTIGGETVELTGWDLRVDDLTLLGKRGGREAPDDAPATVGAARRAMDSTAPTCGDCGGVGAHFPGCPRNTAGAR